MSEYVYVVYCGQKGVTRQIEVSPIVGEIREILSLGRDIGAKRVEVVGNARGTLVILIGRDFERSLRGLQEPASFSPWPLHPLDEPFGSNEVGERGGDVVGDLCRRFRL